MGSYIDDIVRNDSILRHARKLKVQAIISTLVEMEDMSVERVALTLCKLYNNEIDDVIHEVYCQRPNLLFLTVLEIAKKLRYKIFRSKLLYHIDRGTDREFLSQYMDEEWLFGLIELCITPRSKSYRQYLEHKKIRAAFKRVLPPTDIEIFIGKIKDPNVSIEEAAEIVKKNIENDADSVVSFISLLNMRKLVLSASNVEEERRLATKIDAVLDIIKSKEKIIRPVNDFKD